MGIVSRVPANVCVKIGKSEYKRTCDEAFVEGLVCEILIVFLEVLFGRRDELHGCKLISGSSVSSFGLSTAY